MSDIVKCRKCKKEIEKENAIHVEGSKAYYCELCWKEKEEQEDLKEERELLMEVVKDVFNCGMDAKLWTEVKRLKTLYNFTPKMIAMCIDYLYRVKKKSFQVPNFYSVDVNSVSAAMKYFNDLKLMKAKQVESINKYNKQQEVVVVNFKERDTSQLIDLSTLIEGDAMKWC